MTATASKTVRDLEPVKLWNHFADLNAIPRPSKKEERVIEFARQFGENQNLETIVDSVGNVIIRKPASAGYEDRVPIVLQAHLDMVCQQNADTDFDFDQQGIQMLVADDWVRANGTTLGADNGIGVAAIMAILSSDDIVHPPVEALFTIDEETGMTGAKGLQGGVLNGKILLNLDTEDDTELTIGCAGGVDVLIEHAYTPEPVPPGMTVKTLSVTGLQGGHSGMDIQLGRGNANKLMNRILWSASRNFGLRVVSIDGGGLRNAIPRESHAVVAVPADQLPAFDEWLARETETIKSEYQATDPKCHIATTPSGGESVLPVETQSKCLGAVYGCPNGIFRMSPEIPDLVQTSNNLARVRVENGEIEIGCLTRSSVNSERDDLADMITALFEMTGATITRRGEYPGWKPSPDSMIVKLMSDLYQELYGESAHVAACHAGLECGIVGTHYPEMQMISFGPNIHGAHSPAERVQISSVQKFWNYLLETLKRIPQL